MKKVLMIARAFPPLRCVGHSIRVVKFIKYLPALGWLPSVLTIDDQREYTFDRKQGSETLLSDIPQGVKIFRTVAGESSLEFLERERRFGQRNWLTAIVARILGRLRHWVFRYLLIPDQHLTWLPFALRWGRQIVKSEDIEIIFATCPPNSVALIGTLLKLLTRKPLVLDFRDDWIDTPWYYSKPLIIRLFERKMESWVVKNADKVILVTEWSKNAFLDRYSKEPRDKFVLIPNGCDLEELVGLNSVKSTSLNSKFKIIHAGSLYDSGAWMRSLAPLLQAVAHIVQQQPELAEEINLIFIGDYPDGHRRLAEKMALSGIITTLGHLPHDEVLRLLKSADLLLAINYEGFSTLIPGKIYEYWAVDGPPILLLSCPGAAASFVKQHCLGLTVEPSDVAGIQQAILTIFRQSKSATPMRVSTAGIEAYDRRALTIKLAQTLTAVAP